MYFSKFKLYKNFWSLRNAFFNIKFKQKKFTTAKEFYHIIVITYFQNILKQLKDDSLAVKTVLYLNNTLSPSIIYIYIYYSLFVYFQILPKLLLKIISFWRFAMHRFLVINWNLIKYFLDIHDIIPSPHTHTPHTYTPLAN